MENITLEEAKKLYPFAAFEILLFALQVFKNHEPIKTRDDILNVAGICFNAGRIAGIRQERARRMNAGGRAR